MRKVAKSLVWIVGIVALLLGIARLAGLRTWTVPEDPILAASLAPTLRGGDTVIVLFRGKRGLGDLVRCTDPEDAQRWVAGRIYGLPGDTVSVERGVATVNGRKYVTTERCLENDVDIVDPATGGTTAIECSRVELGGGWHFVGTGPRTETRSEEHKVGPEHFFVLSDNRNNPEDSRQYGSLEQWRCRDKLLFRLWGKGGFFDESSRFEYLR